MINLCIINNVYKTYVVNNRIIIVLSTILIFNIDIQAESLLTLI